jgi:4-amino-4-deoxy-L-arabinose transferase-like glycosyltransferase
VSATKSISNPVKSRPAGAPGPASGVLRPAYRVAVLALLLLVAGEIVLSTRQESQVMDEANHLYAGYEYWKHGDFGRNPEHPPLAKLVAASALLPLHLTEPQDPRGSFKYRDFYDGARFLYGADADLLLARGRGMLLIFSLGLALAVFAAGREMFGPEAGLLAMALFCLEPILLANGGLILTDMTLSCLLFVSVVAFYRYGKRPTLGRLLLCSTAVGLTLVAKQSGVLVFPILAVIAVVDALWQPRQARGDRVVSARSRAVSFAAAFAVSAIVSYAMLWAFYGFRYAARPDGLAMAPTLQAYSSAIPVRLEAAAIAFCARHHLLPEAYLYGWADILQVPGLRVSFVLGKLYPGSSRFGLPVMILMKTTITLLVLLLLVPFAGIWRRRREFLFLAVPAALFLLIAMVSGMNAEARYILPIYPFSIVLAGAAGWEMARRSRGWAIGVAALLVFAAASSLHAFPDYLAYCNEAFGGPAQSYRLMAGTNGDGGQGLKWVKSYLDTNHLSDCWFDYVDPFVDPKYYGIQCRPLVSEMVLQGSPLLGQVPPAISGTVLISATEMAGRSWEPDTLNPYAQFSHLEPDANLGNVVLVYRGTFDVHLLSAYSHSLTSKRLLGEGKMAEAVAEAQEAAQLAPDSASMQAGLGLTLIEAGRKQEGQQVNATALRLARSVYPQFQGQLIQLLEKSGMTGPPPK